MSQACDSHEETARPRYPIVRREESAKLLGAVAGKPGQTTFPQTCERHLPVALDRKDHLGKYGTDHDLTAGIPRI
jgi:hypothetical protein